MNNSIPDFLGPPILSTNEISCTCKACSVSLSNEQPDKFMLIWIVIPLFPLCHASQAKHLLLPPYVANFAKPPEMLRRGGPQS